MSTCAPIEPSFSAHHRNVSGTEATSGSHRRACPGTARCGYRAPPSSVRDSSVTVPPSHSRPARPPTTRRPLCARDPAWSALRPSPGSRRRSLVERVSVGLIRGECLEVVPTAVRKVPCQKRRPCESLEPDLIRLGFPCRRRLFQSHRVTTVERTVPAGRLDHGQRDTLGRRRQVGTETHTRARSPRAAASVIAPTPKPPSQPPARRAPLIKSRSLWAGLQAGIRCRCRVGWAVRVVGGC
jgi:hypothetical protein